MLDSVQVVISDQPICIDQALSFIQSKTQGAEAIFIGRVRNFNQGQEVLAIDYEIFQPLALILLRQFSEEAQKKYDPHLRICIHHREGKLVPGQIGMLVAVSSPHRAEAYAANRAIVEAIKHQCPIWKKEFYSSNEFKWLEGCPIRHEH